MVTVRAGRAPASDVLERLMPGYPDRGHWRRVPVTGQHYLDLGSGRPVLFLHGNPSWSYVWRKLLHRLAPHARCLAPDLPGFGLSRHLRPAGGVPDPYEAQLEGLDTLHRHLVRDRGLPARGWTFVLHDWGGPLGAAWALRNPGVVERLVVCNTVAFPFPEGFRLPFYLRWIRDHRPVAGLAHLTNGFARTAVRAGVHRPLSPAERRALLRPYARRAERGAVTDAVRAIPRDPADPVWRLLEPSAGGPGLAELPLLVGWGMRDPVFTPGLLGEWERRFPGAAVHRFPEAGHYVMEDAAPELAYLVRDFLGAR
ncbi:alpha/beta fold hydrolase [Streptomyces sp. PAL114]|uniref:alpha/beta fold hydrolase n=1 Tax=Streptomyces sp. PAL114 TaxID=2970893 RepID=UPI0028FCFCFD|nr:alpha/beta fold hydrolase [Streptomyces sp. PAL114]MDU0304398.1 alpha/beta fold hydrolase [Streptomyces sp. PAL114]